LVYAERVRKRTASVPLRPRPRAEEHRTSTLARWLPAGILVLVGCLTYSNTFRNPFIFDDEQTITENQQIRSLGDLGAVLNPERELPTAGRPFVNLTFAINYAFGGLDEAGYHVWNLATHLICAILLLAIVRRTLEMQAGWLRQHAERLAFAAALIWTVHPLNSEAVDYVTQRTELTMAAMLLLTLYASIRGLVMSRRLAWSLIAVCACALGMASKESMVTAPLLVVLYDRTFVFASLRDAWATRKKLYLGLMATWLFLAALLSTAPRKHSAGFSSGVSPAQYLIDQLPMVTRYLRLSFWPHSLVHNYGTPPHMTLASVTPYALLIGGLILLTLAAFRRMPKLAFLGAWIWITLAPTSSIVPIATEVGAERRMYLPLMALVTLVVVAGVGLSRRFDRRAHLAMLIAVTATLATLTFVRNRAYASPIVLARTTLARYPTPVAHHVLAAELLVAGQRQEAVAHLRLAVPGAPRAHYTLGVALLEDGQTDEGIAELQSFIRAEPHLALAVEAHEYLGKAYAQRNQWPDAIREFQAMLAIVPGHPQAERLLAGACFNANDMPAAIVHYGKYLEVRPNDADALNQFGAALGSAGRLDEAIAAFVRAEQLDPQNGVIQFNLAYTLYQRRDVANALVHAERAATLQPGDERARALLRMLRQ
jgi:tetratricopeptide (TPR) repeat protein